ncbi:MAG TPA: DUF1697 domain-containing protein [Gaiellales bacterium]|jgi:uncharacterized protein (DUF1697 family)
MSRLVALLRGVNLGAARRLPMADLRASMERLGYDDVHTVLQSGNVVYTGGDSADRSEQRIRAQLRDDTGMDVPVMVRTARQMEAVVRRNPLSDHASDPKRHHVVFLAGRPAAARGASLDPAAFEPERFALHGRELYVWWPDGAHRARLTLPAIERRLGVSGTARNWNTVEKLAELAAG